MVLRAVKLPLTCFVYDDCYETILLADGSENDLLLMRAAFGKAEFKNPVWEVHNGEEAIAYLKGEGVYADRAQFPLPIVMILDLNMPITSGFGVLLWLRAQPRLRRLMVAVMTASVRPGRCRTCTQPWSKRVLVKPGTMQD